MHEGDADHSLADYNRAGVPLLEIVSEPDMTSGIAAAAYGEEIRRIVRFLGVSDGNMQVRVFVQPLFSGGEYYEKQLKRCAPETCHRAAAYGEDISRIVQFLGVSDGDMQVQSFLSRCLPIRKG